MLHSLLHHPRLHPHLSHFIASSSSLSSLYPSLPLLLLLLILHHLFGLFYNLLILLLRLPPPSLLLLLLFSPLLLFLILSFLFTLRHVRLVAPPFCISARCSFYSPTAGLYLAPSSSHLTPVPDASYEIFSWSAPFCPYTLGSLRAFIFHVLLLPIRPASLFLLCFYSPVRCLSLLACSLSFHAVSFDASERASQLIKAMPSWSPNYKMAGAATWRLKNLRGSEYRCPIPHSLRYSPFDSSGTLRGVWRSPFRIDEIAEHAISGKN